MEADIWTYRSGADLGADVTRAIDVAGFEVEALDGGIGKVDEATYEVGKSSIVVDTGPWIFGKKVLLPAGVIDRIDLENEKVFVHRTKDEIKSAPELDLDTYRDTGYRNEVGSYYGQGGAGWRDRNMVP